MRASIMLTAIAATATLFAALSPRPAALAQPYDHVRNGAFDDGTAMWTGASPAALDIASVGGNPRARLTGHGGTTRIYQRLDAALGAGTYSVSMIARADSPADVTISVESYVDPSSRIVFTERAGDAWREVGGAFSLAAAIDARIVIEAALPAAGAAYLDDVRLEGPPPVVLPPAPTPSPGATPATAPAASATAATAPAPQPTLEPTPTPRIDIITGALRNDGFEEVTPDDQPFAWEKYGGALTSSTRARSGARSARLDSASASTKWLHQTVRIDGGRWYAFGAWLLYDDPGVASAFLRVSWYASDDAHGSAIATSDSPAPLDPPAIAWRLIGTGPIAAPPDARSARLRVMLVPRGAAHTSIEVDDASFGPAQPPPPAAPFTGVISPAAQPAAPPVHASSALGPSRPGDVVAAPRAAAPTAASPHIVLNEVLYDPAGDATDAAGEWVEIYNTGDASVDLAGWTLADAAAAEDLPALVVPARGYAIVAASDSIWQAFAASGVAAIVLDGRIGNGLGNSGDALYLIDKSGAIADAVSWGDTRTPLDPPVADVPEGHSIERTIPGADSGAAGDWSDNAMPSPGRAFAPVAMSPRATGGGRTIDVARRGAAFAWLPWAAMAMSAAAVAGTIGWRAIEEARSRRAHP